MTIVIMAMTKMITVKNDYSNNYYDKNDYCQL